MVQQSRVQKSHFGCKNHSFGVQKSHIWVQKLQFLSAKITVLGCKKYIFGCKNNSLWVQKAQFWGAKKTVVWCNNSPFFWCKSHWLGSEDVPFQRSNCPSRCKEISNACRYFSKHRSSILNLGRVLEPCTSALTFIMKSSLLKTQVSLVGQVWPLPTRTTHPERECSTPIDPNPPRLCSLFIDVCVGIGCLCLVSAWGWECCYASLGLNSLASSPMCASACCLNVKLKSCSPPNAKRSSVVSKL